MNGWKEERLKEGPCQNQKRKTNIMESDAIAERLLKKGFTKKQVFSAVTLFPKGGAANDFLSSLSSTERDEIEQRELKDILVDFERIPERQTTAICGAEWKVKCSNPFLKGSWACLHCGHSCHNDKNNDGSCSTCGQPSGDHPDRRAGERILFLLFSHLQPTHLAQIVVDYILHPHIRENLLPFYQHQWLDVMDSDGCWIDAQVLQVKDKRALIHYRGWKAHYDEWIDPVKDLHRVTFYQSHTYVSVWVKQRLFLAEYPLSSSLQPQNGLPSLSSLFTVQELELLTGKITMHVLDSNSIWYDGSILEHKVTRKTTLVLIAYQGWSAKFNEWIIFPSHRIITRFVE